MPRIEEDRDLAHERDMEMLRKEQLRADFSDSELEEIAAEYDEYPDEYWPESPVCEDIEWE